MRESFAANRSDDDNKSFGLDSCMKYSMLWIPVTKGYAQRNCLEKSSLPIIKILRCLACLAALHLELTVAGFCILENPTINKSL